MSVPNSEMTTAVAMVTQATDDTADQLAARLRTGLGGAPADLCLLFSSAHFEDELPGLAERLHELLGARTFAGVSADGVICGDREFQEMPALVAWAAHLPGVSTVGFHLSHEDVERLDTPDALAEHMGVPRSAEPNFILFVDPFTFHPVPYLNALLDNLDATWPGRPVVGGLASAAEQPGQNQLIFEGLTLHHGLVGVALWGPLRLDTVVSQGCRPIWHHLVVTRSEGNLIHELGGRPPLEVVKRLLGEVSPKDRALLQRRGLLLGSVINEYQEEFGQGDFLIRHPLGFDPDSGAMAVNDLVRTGQTVQFQVRDADSADEAMNALLAAQRRQPVCGALLFTCNGRGRNLFRQRDHDARALSEACGGRPVAGFFAAGELGPVGGRTFIHSHAASIGLLRPVHPEAHG